MFSCGAFSVSIFRFFLQIFRFFRFIRWDDHFPQSTCFQSPVVSNLQLFWKNSGDRGLENFSNRFTYVYSSLLPLHPPHFQKVITTTDPTLPLTSAFLGNFCFTLSRISSLPEEETPYPIAVSIPLSLAPGSYATTLYGFACPGQFI